MKGQRFFLAHPQEAVGTIMEFTSMRDRALGAKVYDHYMSTFSRDGAIPERLQQVVIERSKRLVGVTREVRPEEIFDFSFLRRASMEVDRSGWKP